MKITKRHYDRLEKEVKIYARKDTALYIEELTTEAEKAAKTGNGKSLFNIMKHLRNKPPKTNIPIKDKKHWLQWKNRKNDGLNTSKKH